MPKKEIDYSQTLIYKIVCKDLTIPELYVGHTNNFRVRKNKHKWDCNKKDFLIYKTINNNGGWDNWEMIEIEKYPCKDGNEARARERYWYEELNAKLNSFIPLRTNEEKQNYYQEKKSEISIQQKTYYETNKEKINEKINCECGCIITKKNMTKHKKTKKHLGVLINC